MTEHKMENKFFNYFQNKSFEEIEKEYKEKQLCENNDTQPANQHQKHWEKLLGLYLKDNLIEGEFIRPNGQGMPDFLFTKDNKKIWFECVASEKPKLKEDNQYWLPKNWTPETITPENLDNDIIEIGDTLRPYQLCYYQMLQEKEEQCKKRIEKGIIDNNDFNILCINGYLFEQNDFFTPESNLYYETFCGRKVYRNIQDITALGKLSNVLFGLIDRSDVFRIDEGNGFCFERPYGYKFFHKTKNGDEIYKLSDGYYDGLSRKKLDMTEEDIKRDYLQCNFFCRKDFPFNGILFSNISYEWKNTKLVSIELENKKQTEYNKYSLYYLQNPCKSSCIEYFENLCECINCDVFYKNVMLFNF